MTPQATRSEADIPTAFTPTGGYTGPMPSPILAGCTDPLTREAPDLRGTWRATAVYIDGQAATDDHPIHGHIERIEQAADRVVITGEGVVHDMRADGNPDHGVNDVMAADHTTPISVAASFEDGALVLHPQGMPDVVVRRWREGDELVFEYSTLFTARMARIDTVPD